MSTKTRRKGGFANAKGPSKGLKATTPALGRSPRDEKGRSTLRGQRIARTEQDVRSQLLDKMGQAGIEALFDLAKGRRS